MRGSSEVDVHVGKRLRFARTMKGMTQEGIGEAIGVSFQQVQKYERGVNCIRISKLLELAKVLKVPVGFFFDTLEEGGEEKYSIPGAADSGDMAFDMETSLSRESMELMRAFHRISNPQLRSKVLDIVRAMADDKVTY